MPQTVPQARLSVSKKPIQNFLSPWSRDPYETSITDVTIRPWYTPANLADTATRTRARSFVPGLSPYKKEWPFS